MEYAKARNATLITIILCIFFIILFTALLYFAFRSDGIVASPGASFFYALVLAAFIVLIIFAIGAAGAIGTTIVKYE